MVSEEHAPLIVGKISGVFGVKGWIKVFDYSRERGDVLQYGKWLLGRKGHWCEREIEEGQVHGKGVIAKLVGCDDRDTATALQGNEIAVRREWLEPPARGQYYWFQLQGLAVSNLEGESLGQIAALMETGANDVLVIREMGDSGEIRAERLVPYIDSVVKEVDLKQGRVTVDWELDF